MPAQCHAETSHKKITHIFIRFETNEARLCAVCRFTVEDVAQLVGRSYVCTMKHEARTMSYRNEREKTTQILVLFEANKAGVCALY